MPLAILVRQLFLVVISAIPLAAQADPNPMAQCICGGRQTLWGQPLGASPPGVGELSLRLSGEATFLELRDPLGRWIRYDRANQTYRSEIPNADCDREPVETEHDDEDTTAVADTSRDNEQEFQEFYEHRARIPGPLDGDYLLRVVHAPRADWFLQLNAEGGVAPTSTYDGLITPVSHSDTVSSYRLRWNLAGNALVQVDSVGSEYLPPLRLSRRVLRLPCESDPFDTLSAPNARVDARGPGKPKRCVSLPDGVNSYEAGPGMMSGGHHVGVEYGSHPAFRFEGAARDTYLL